MPNPLDYLPLRIAAAEGSVGGHDAGALVAAGTTLLQRCAPLVIELTKSTPFIHLPTGPAMLTAISACQGSTAILTELDKKLVPVDLLFTMRDLRPEPQKTKTVVLLDECPKFATVINNGIERRVDLGSHVGISLTGDMDSEGNHEPVLGWFDGTELKTASHRDVFNKSFEISAPGYVGNIVNGFLRPLLAGESI